MADIPDQAVRLSTQKHLSVWIINSQAHPTEIQSTVTEHVWHFRSFLGLSM